jgi:indole-3-glycerol phosphate synthase
VTILAEILEHKRAEVERDVAATPRDVMRQRAQAVQDEPRGFRRALANGEPPAVIAEIKRRSPSKGLIRSDFDPVKLARSYAEGGAAALSVLTDEHYFGGHLDFLAQVRDAVGLPLLRKDFVIDAYQIDQARSAGADAVLLIVSALAPAAIDELYAHAKSLGLDVVVEVHEDHELELALDVGADLIGVNNRDLKTFEVDLSTTERLAARLPSDRDIILVAESGIGSYADVKRLDAAGAGAFLVGESLMREPDPGKALEALRKENPLQPARETS